MILVISGIRHKFIMTLEIHWWSRIRSDGKNGTSRTGSGAFSSFPTLANGAMRTGHWTVQVYTMLYAPCAQREGERIKVVQFNFTAREDSQFPNETLWQVRQIVMSVFKRCSLVNYDIMKIIIIRSCDCGVCRVWSAFVCNPYRGCRLHWKHKYWRNDFYREEEHKEEKIDDCCRSEVVENDKKGRRQRAHDSKENIKKFTKKDEADCVYIFCGLTQNT